MEKVFEMEGIINIALKDFIRIAKPRDFYNNELAVLEIDGQRNSGGAVRDFTLRFEAHSTFLVKRGEVTITADYLPYRITRNMVLEFNNMHLLNSICTSPDTRAYFIMVDKNIYRELIPRLSAIPKEYFMYKRFNPMQKYESQEFSILLDCIERIKNNIRRSDHIFHRNLVINEVGNYLMELTNMSMDKINSIKNDYKSAYTEDLISRFLQLLVKHGHEWREVSQYSTELCVTPVYLSRAVKASSGKTPMEWINEARVSEAKILLRKPDMLINEVADVLKFSDQSSFGKFFKKHTGLSPLEYKRNF